MTKMTDLIHNVKPVVAVAPQSVTGAKVSSLIDTIGYYALLLTVAGEGAITKVQECDTEDFEGATDVPATQLIEKDGAINVVPTKRYIKATITTESAQNVCVLAHLFGADIEGV